MLIGGLATAILFISISASVQSEPTIIQVTEDPYPYEVVEIVMAGLLANRTALLNRETGELEFIYANYNEKAETGNRYVQKTFDFERHQ